MATRSFPVHQDGHGTARKHLAHCQKEPLSGQKAATERGSGGSISSVRWQVNSAYSASENVTETLSASKQRGTDTVPHEAESMRQDLAGNAIDNAE